MKRNFIAKALIVVSLIWTLSFKGLAWTVSETVVQLPDEQENLGNSPLLRDGEQVIQKGSFSSSEHAKIRPEEKAAVVNHRGSEKEALIFSKKDATLSSEEEALNDLRRAQLYLKNRNYPKAEKYLINTLNRLPNHHASRVELASLYLKENQLEEAENLLLDGFKYDENNPDFLRLMAMIHDKREEPEKALALLVKVKESRRQDTNYIAFLGHIYQEMGQYGLARQQYYRLLQLEPTNTMWLLGVSIALDAEGQKEAALEGYYRLAREGNIEPKILQYVQARINHLKG